MQTITITLGLLLAGACFVIGRSSVINERLRRKIKKSKESIGQLNGLLDQEYTKHAETSRMLASITSPLASWDKKFNIKNCGDASVVCMDVYLSDKTISVPIKSFFDDDDPDFARNEAVELCDKCNE